MKFTAYSSNDPPALTVEVQIDEKIVIPGHDLNSAITEGSIVEYIYEQGRAAATSAFDKVMLAIAQATKTDLYWNEGTARFGLAEKYREDAAEWQERCGAAEDKLNIIAEAHRAMREANEIIEGIE